MKIKAATHISIETGMGTFSNCNNGYGYYSTLFPISYSIPIST